jgi:hypothetical protein
LQGISPPESPLRLHVPPSGRNIIPTNVSSANTHQDLHSDNILNSPLMSGISPLISPISCLSTWHK